jgi:hypothetical protein
MPNVCLSRSGNEVMTKVAEQIPISYSWNGQIVQQTFTEEDAQSILQIPLQERADDTIVWHSGISIRRATSQLSLHIKLL